MSKKRLWDKGQTINEAVLAFTVGKDPEYDKHILAWDVVASAAHARMLQKQNLISEADLNSLLPALENIHSLALTKSLDIPIELEDGHTLIESILTEKCGDPGKRIHLGRSRNDQVLVAVRLWLKEQTNILAVSLLSLAEQCAVKAKNTLKIQMPGYTHFQQAMPASVGMWFHAVCEHAIELSEQALALSDLLDRSPLGVGSGFSSPLPIDRAYTTELLGFSKTQRSPINTQNSRGRYETQFCRLCSDVSSLIEKFSFDLILFNMQELGFVKLPDSFTTGSSIMPQKRNPDVLELLRASASQVRGKQSELENLCAKLPSHYHRDFQLSKGPAIESQQKTSIMLSLFAEVLSEVVFDEDVLKKTKTPELYATYAAFRLVQDGLAFRDAYSETAKLLKDGKINIGELSKDFDIIADGLLLEIQAAENSILSQTKMAKNTIASINKMAESIFKVGQLI